jgi:hypothetical protein
MMMPILFFFVLLRIIIYYRLFLLNEVDRNVYTLGSGTSIEVGQNPQVVEWNNNKQEGKSHTDFHGNTKPITHWLYLSERNLDWAITIT